MNGAPHRNSISSGSGIASSEPATLRERPWIVLLGPTSSGKTETAVLLAERFAGEIVSCDSMQVYKRLDVGTAKPPPALRRRVPHHLIDIVPFHERYDLNRFLRDAREAIAGILNGGNLPIVVGGTGLYARSLVYGIDPPAADPGLYEQLEQVYAHRDGPVRLYAELAASDPDYAEEVKRNPRRLLRAVERLRLTGQPRPPGPLRNLPPKNILQLILYPAPTEHKLRIARRVDRMLEAGWTEEVLLLARDGLFDSPTARQALGYRLIYDFIEASTDAAPDSREHDALGERNRQELRRRLIRATWAYARRQRTWFRHQHPGAIQIPLRSGVTCIQLANGLAAIIEQHIQRFSDT